MTQENPDPDAGFETGASAPSLRDGPDGPPQDIASTSGEQDEAPLVEEGRRGPSRNRGDEGSFGDQAAEMANETEVEGEVDVGSDDELTLAQMALAERTADLQRLQAEFLNYKRRVDRDRELIRENATYVVLSPIVEVLDTIDRAREHAPLEGGFKAVAEQLERVVSGLGLTKYGEPGDVFDPTVHEALSHLGEDPEVTEPTAKMVAKAGYKIGDRVVRAAQVLVVDPASQ